MKVLALIHHEVAGAGVFPEVVAQRGHELEFWTPSEEPLPRPLTDYGAVIAFGGGMQADQEHIHPWLLTALDALRQCLREEVPTLGVCLGGQMLARAAGGRVGPAPRAECGWEPVELTAAGLMDPLFEGLGPVFEVYQWHSYEFGLPPEAVLLARSGVSFQCFRVGACAWGLQWHPEVTGASMLKWAQEHRPAPGGVPVSVDMEALKAQIAERVEATNEDGRQLCARFLAAAEIRSGADPPARAVRRVQAGPSPAAP
jgi:GMP synthase-like glutamine amidotransferase